jgi:hypothetical protein
VDVVAVHDESTSHGAKELAHEIDGELSPGMTSEEAVGESDGRVEMTTGLLADVDAQHDTQSIITQIGQLFSPQTKGAMAAMVAGDDIQKERREKD